MHAGHRSHAVQGPRGHPPPAGRRVKLPPRLRPLLPGKVPLQPRAQRDLLQVSFLCVCIFMQTRLPIKKGEKLFFFAQEV